MPPRILFPLPALKVSPAVLVKALGGGTTRRATHYLIKPKGKWELTQNGNAIQRTFKFRNFSKAWDFMTAVSIQSKLHNHHPEWSNVYNHVFVRWTTHTPPSLSGVDMRLAKLCDELATQLGEQTLETVQSKTTDSLDKIASKIKLNIQSPRRFTDSNTGGRGSSSSDSSNNSNSSRRSNATADNSGDISIQTSSTPKGKSVTTLDPETGPQNVPEPATAATVPASTADRKDSIISTSSVSLSTPEIPTQDKA